MYISNKLNIYFHSFMISNNDKIELHYLLLSMYSPILYQSHRTSQTNKDKWQAHYEYLASKV